MIILYIWLRHRQIVIWQIIYISGGNEMNVEIKKLTPAHVEEYINFFETTPHDDNIPEHTCYCECWCSADHRFGTGIPSREERKAMAIEYVKSGKIQGYLAYFDGSIVGWCNANTKTQCLNCIGWYRFMP